MALLYKRYFFFGVEITEEEYNLLFNWWYFNFQDKKISFYCFETQKILKSTIIRTMIFTKDWIA